LRRQRFGIRAERSGEIQIFKNLMSGFWNFWIPDSGFGSGEMMARASARSSISGI